MIKQNIRHKHRRYLRRGSNSQRKEGRGKAITMIQQDICMGRHGWIVNTNSPNTKDKQLSASFIISFSGKYAELYIQIYSDLLPYPPILLNPLFIDLFVCLFFKLLIKLLYQLLFMHEDYVHVNQGFLFFESKTKVMVTLSVIFFFCCTCLVWLFCLNKQISNKIKSASCQSVGIHSYKLSKSRL